MNDAGHEAVGQALLIGGVALGALGVAELHDHLWHSLTELISALS